LAELGFVGLGTMGGRMVEKFLEAGHRVTGYNRTRSKADRLVDAGMAWAETPREAAAAAEVTLSMVTGTPALEEIANGRDGILAGLGPGKVWVDMSTVSPTASAALAERVAETTGARMLDAPVSGSVVTLEEGKLSLMVGGEADVVERVRPILQAIGPKITYVGSNGQAVLMKVATNINLAVQMLAFSEAVLLAEKGGIERETAVEVLLNSVIASPMVKYRGPFVLGQPDEAWFDVDMMQKDLLLAQEAGRRLNVPLPTTAVTNELLTSARAMGFDKKDFAVLFETLARMSGVTQ
jgi:3-hydroxyisobutyrate dehydrogenase-like beta-hydroxyacid dehydrogenase